MSASSPAQPSILGASPPSLYRAYASALWKTQKFFGAWPPVMTDIALGSYGSLSSSGGFTKLGDITVLAGIVLPPAQPPSQQLGFCLSSDSVSSSAFSVTAGVEAPVPDVGVVTGDAVLKYTTTTNVACTVAVNALATTDISDSVEDWLREEVWPALSQLSKGSWNDDWRLVCSIYTTDGYALAGGAGSGTAFNFGATGTVLGDMLDGKLTTSIDITQVRNVSLSECAVNLTAPALIGCQLWHFSKGQPQLDSFS